MDSHNYIHGYDAREQARLLSQADYWRERLILPDLPFHSGESLLEIGCGAGAVLGVLGQAHPQLALAGIDLETRQIEHADRHLQSLGLSARLQTGNALKLPFADNSFDHIYMMWFLEHVTQPVLVLREALRVLRPGGSITANETDYSRLQIYPETAGIVALKEAFCSLFNLSGSAVTGPNLETWLAEAGFEKVACHVIPWRFDNSSGALNLHSEYLLGFIEPSLDAMAGLPGRSRELISQGISDLRSVGTRPDGKISLPPWRARAWKPRA